MKSDICVSTSGAIFLLLLCLPNVKRVSSSETALCDKPRLMEMKEMVKKCWELAYINFLEEKLDNVEDFEARCNYLNYKVGYELDFFLQYVVIDYGFSGGVCFKI